VLFSAIVAISVSNTKFATQPILPLLTVTIIAASGKAPTPSDPTYATTKEFVGTTHSDMVQQKFEARFDRPLNRVECKDNGLCYQRWGKDCTKAIN